MNRGMTKTMPIGSKPPSKANIHNRFDIEVLDSKTGEVRQRAQAFNVICSGFWTNFSGYFYAIAYGSGNGVPSASDVALFNKADAVKAESHALGNDLASGVSYRTKKITLSETASVGVTITEVGLAYSTSSSATSYLSTHAMIQDMNGNPISITKTATDIITIYATVFVHWVPSGQNGVYLEKPERDSLVPIMGYILGYSYSLSSGYYAEAYTYVGKGTLRTGNPSRPSDISFNSSTKVITSIAPRMAVDQGNHPGGFGFVVLKDTYYGDDPYQAIDVRGLYEVSSETVGTGDGSTTEFVTKFDLPRSAVVKVDGVVLTSGVSVYPHPISTNAADYFCCIEPVLHNEKPCIRGGEENPSVGDKFYLLNTLHEFGVASITLSGCTFAFSEDMTNWSKEFPSGVSISTEFRNYKYIRATRTSGSGNLYPNATTATFPSGLYSKNIVFDTPPAEGSVITIDYITPFVPKDENHVYDLTFTVQLGEYAG